MTFDHPATPPTRHRLWAHPSTPSRTVKGLWASINHSSAGNTLHLRYELQAPLDQLRLPPAAPVPQAMDRLWQHTCFEAFVGSPASSAYREFNFSPSGHWATYVFSTERVRAAPDRAATAPRMACHRHETGLSLDAWLPRQSLPEDGQIVLGLAAVVETRDGQLSHWALAHPRTHPDFHDRRGWALRLSIALAQVP